MLKATKHASNQYRFLFIVLSPLVQIYINSGCAGMIEETAWPLSLQLIAVGTKAKQSPPSPFVFIIAAQTNQRGGVAKLVLGNLSHSPLAK